MFHISCTVLFFYVSHTHIHSLIDAHFDMRWFIALQISEILWEHTISYARGLVRGQDPLYFAMVEALKCDAGAIWVVTGIKHLMI